MKYIQVLLIIFCLGIFLIPKDNFYAQASQQNCCKKEFKTSGCCEKNHHDNSKNNGKKHGKSSCNDDCCSYCAICYTSIENASSKSFFLEFSSFQTDKNLQFEYSDPYISDNLKDIWQPPKLG